MERKCEEVMVVVKRKKEAGVATSKTYFRSVFVWGPVSVGRVKFYVC